MTAVPEQAPNRHLCPGSSAAGLPVGVAPATVRAGREHGGPATEVTGPRELRRSAPVVPPRWEDLGPPCGGVLLAAKDVPERLGADAMQVQVDALLLSASLWWRGNDRYPDTAAQRGAAWCPPGRSVVTFKALWRRLLDVTWRSTAVPAVAGGKGGPPTGDARRRWILAGAERGLR
jgi:hypothetical protein